MKLELEFSRVDKALKTRKRAPKMAESRNFVRAVVKSKQIESKKLRHLVYNARELRDSLGGQTLVLNLNYFEEEEVSDSANFSSLFSPPLLFVVLQSFLIRV